jgi:hypothetical protein
MSSSARNHGATRRELVAGAFAGAGLLGVLAAPAGATHDVTSEDLLNAAATAEAVTAIVATVGQESGRASGSGLDARARAVVQAAARADLTHHDVLSAPRLGGRADAQRIWVPDDVFADGRALLRSLVALKDVLVNVYLIGATTFGNDGNGRFARFCAEIAGVEAVHRALCLDALGLFAADRVFLRYSQPEENPDAPGFNRAGFRRIESASRYLREAGFGLGESGAGPGSFITLDEVRGRTPNPAALNTRGPR